MRTRRLSRQRGGTKQQERPLRKLTQQLRKMKGPVRFTVKKQGASKSRASGSRASRSRPSGSRAPSRASRSRPSGSRGPSRASRSRPSGSRAATARSSRSRPSGSRSAAPSAKSTTSRVKFALDDEKKLTAKKLTPKEKDYPQLAKAFGAHLLTPQEKATAKKTYGEGKPFELEKERVKELAINAAPRANIDPEFYKKYAKKSREVFERMEVPKQCTTVIGDPADKKCYICGYKLIPETKFYEFQTVCEHLLPIRHAILKLDVIQPKNTTESGRVITAEEKLENPEYKSMISLEYKWAHQLCNLVKTDHVLIKLGKDQKYEPDEDKIKKMLWNINVKFVDYNIAPVSLEGRQPAGSKTEPEDMKNRVTGVSLVFQKICDYLNNLDAPLLHDLAGWAVAVLLAKQQHAKITQSEKYKSLGQSAVTTASKPASKAVSKAVSKSAPKARGLSNRQSQSRASRASRAANRSRKSREESIARRRTQKAAKNPSKMRAIPEANNENMNNETSARSANMQGVTNLLKIRQGNANRNEAAEGLVNLDPGNKGYNFNLLPNSTPPSSAER